PGPVFFAEPEHCVLIDAEWADQPLPQADERTARLCEAQCSELLRRRRARPRVAERVRQHLLRLGAPGGRSMEAVAAELAMAPRTLHRHLAAEDTTFRRLLGEVREDLAEEMLAYQMTVDEVAERRGYDETSSFAHAFTHGNGNAPGRANVAAAIGVRRSTEARPNPTVKPPKTRTSESANGRRKLVVLSSASDAPSMSSMSGTAIPPSSLVVARIPAGSSIPVPIRMSARQKAWSIGFLSSDPGDI